MKPISRHPALRRLDPPVLIAFGCLLLLLPVAARGQSGANVFAVADGCPSQGQTDQSANVPLSVLTAFGQAKPCGQPNARLRTAYAHAEQNSVTGMVRADASGNGDGGSTTAMASAHAAGPLAFMALPDPTPGFLYIEISGSVTGDGSGSYYISLNLPSGYFQEQVPAVTGPLGITRVYPYVVPPGGFVGSFLLGVSASASNGTADFGHSAYAWVEGAPLDPSRSDGVLLGARPPMAGDVNRDGRVNAADLEVVRRHLGTSAAVFGTGDADRDGDVDAADLRAVRRAMGTVRGADSAAGLSENPAPTAVPEPTAAWVILAAGALLRPRRSRRNCRPRATGVDSSWSLKKT